MLEHSSSKKEAPMGAIDRRDFLVRSGMAISAAVLAAEIPLPMTHRL